jgi:hypothetical protein
LQRLTDENARWFVRMMLAGVVLVFVNVTLTAPLVGDTEIVAFTVLSPVTYAIAGGVTVGLGVGEGVMVGVMAGVGVGVGRKVGVELGCGAIVADGETVGAGDGLLIVRSPGGPHNVP